MKTEQIAQLLGVQSTDVIVTNNSEARLKDRELTEAEQELIADVFLSEDKKEIIELAKTLRSEMNGKIDKVADIIEGASGQQWATDKKVIADEIKRQK